MQLLKVTAIQRGCVYDGRGVRTTVFLKGCLFHCPWCCNPENISMHDDLFVDESKCLKNKGEFARFCTPCERSGGAEGITNCPLGVGTPTAALYTTEELYAEIMKDAALFTRTDGGVTFSGGEPLLHNEALLPLLERLQQAHIDIAFETTLAVPTESLVAVLPYTQAFIIDLKLQPQMKLFDSEYLALIGRHYSLLHSKRCLIRMVFVDDMLLYAKQIVDALKSLNISSLELLACHNLGAGKYEKLSLPNADFTADRDKMKAFAAYCLKVQIQMKSVCV